MKRLPGLKSRCSARMTGTGHSISRRCPYRGGISAGERVRTLHGATGQVTHHIQCGDHVLELPAPHGDVGRHGGSACHASRSDPPSPRAVLVSTPRRDQAALTAPRSMGGSQCSGAAATRGDRRGRGRVAASPLAGRRNPPPFLAIRIASSTRSWRQPGRKSRRSEPG